MPVISSAHEEADGLTKETDSLATRRPRWRVMRIGQGKGSWNLSPDPACYFWTLDIRFSMILRLNVMRANEMPKAIGTNKAVA